jgi:Protein of unknown function (DUF3618)
MATDPTPATTADQDLNAVPVRPAATAPLPPLADTRSSDEIKADIERTQARLTSTVDALRDKLTPAAILSDATHSVASGALRAVGRASINRQPAAVFFVTLGVALLFGFVFGRRNADEELTQMIDDEADDEVDEFDIDWLEQYP